MMKIKLVTILFCCIIFNFYLITIFFPKLVIISTNEDEQLLVRSREEFKKRLSEVMLQRSLMMISKSTNRQATNDSTSSTTSEIDIPVEHVYTTGLISSIMDVKHEGHHHFKPSSVPKSTLGDNLTVRQQSPSTTTIISQSPSVSLRSSSSRCFTPPINTSIISIVTDNFVKRLVEESPQTGENRELTYTRSRDVIFDVPQIQMQQPSLPPPPPPPPPPPLQLITFSDEMRRGHQLQPYSSSSSKSRKMDKKTLKK